MRHFSGDPVSSDIINWRVAKVFTKAAVFSWLPLSLHSFLNYIGHLLFIYKSISYQLGMLGIYYDLQSSRWLRMISFAQTSADLRILTWEISGALCDQ